MRRGSLERASVASVSGIVLVIVSGILALLLALGFFLLRIAEVSSIQTVARVARARASLSAESGMAYAEVRLRALWPGAYPRYDAPAERRGDGWLRRDPLGTPIERLRNPSFSHGEGWSDIPLAADGIDSDGDGPVDEAWEGDGVLTAGDLPGPDLDGDGSASAWTGRLRGGPRAFSSRFTLDIRSVEGSIPLNDGLLDARDRNGNGVPDHRDLAYQSHRGLAAVVDNLGALLLPVTGTRREALASGFSGAGHLFQLAWLGRDLLSRRPEGGYRSMGQVREAMAAWGYSTSGPRSELDRVAPYLDLGPHEAVADGCRSIFDPAPAPDFSYTPLTLCTVSREVLQSLWMYRKHEHSWHVEEYWNGIPGGGAWGAYSRQGDASFGWMSIVLYRDEALALAEHALRRSRDGAIRDWLSFRAELLANAETIFKIDAEDLAAEPDARRRWTRAKADLAVQAVAMDPYCATGRFNWEDPEAEASATWMGWGIDRHPADGVQQEQWASYGTIHRVPVPPGPGIGWEGGGFWPHQVEELVEIATPPLTLAPPVLFSVGCLGREGGPGGVSARREGRYRVAERIDLASQEDFEAFAGGAGLSKRRGIRVVPVPSPAARRDLRAADPVGALGVPVAASGGAREYPHVVSLPAKSLWSHLPAGAPSSFPRCYGGLALASRQGGLLGAGMYWPDAEDFDGIPATDGLPEVSAAYVPWGGTRLARTSNPYLLSEPMGVGLIPLPGLSVSSDPPHMNAAVEAWVIPGSIVRVFTGGATGTRFWLQAFREQPAGSPPQLVFRVSGFTSPGAPWMVSFTMDEEGAPGARIPSSHHVVFTIQRYIDPVSGEEEFEGRLFLDGGDPPFAGPLTVSLPPMSLIGFQSLIVYYVDELRFYDRPLDARQPPFFVLAPPAEVADRYGQGRFEPTGIYTSPRYELDEPAEIGLAQWTGFLPPGFPAGSLSVSFDPSPGPSALLAAPGKIEDLTGLGPVGSFRYRVLFDCRGVPGALDDTPVFESLWLTLRRPGQSPGWVRREATE